MAAILDFRLEPFKLFLFYQSLLCFLPSFKPAGLPIQDGWMDILFIDAQP